MSLYQQLREYTEHLQIRLQEPTPTDSGTYSSQTEQPSTAELANDALSVLLTALNFMSGSSEPSQAGSLQNTLPKTLNGSLQGSWELSKTNNSSTRNSSPYNGLAAQRAGLSSSRRGASGSSGDSANVSDLRFQINKLISQRKLTRSRTELTMGILKSKLKASTQRNDRYVIVMQEQEVTLREQSEIIRSMKHRLKRTWATDPHIAMSPRTKKLLDRYQKDRNALTEVLTPQLDDSKTSDSTSNISNISNTAANTSNNALLSKDINDITISPANHSMLAALSAHSLEQGGLAKHILICAHEWAAKQSTIGSNVANQLQGIVLYDESRNLMWRTENIRNTTKTKTKTKTRIKTERISAKCPVILPNSREREHDYLSKEIGSLFGDQVSSSTLWLPIRDSTEIRYLAFLLVATTPDTNANSSQADTMQLLAFWSTFAMQIHNLIETSIMLNRVQSVFTQAVARLPSVIASSSSLGPTWNLLERIGARCFNETLNFSVRAIDRERSEFVRYIKTTTSTEQNDSNFYEVRHDIRTGQPTYNRDREGRYRGYGIQMVNTTNQLHPCILKRFDEDEDDCFISFGPARSVLAATMADGKGRASGIIELSRRIGGAYSSAEEVAMIQFTRQAQTLLSMATVMFKQQQQIATHIGLQQTLVPVSLSGLTGESNLLQTLAIKTKELLQCERCLWFLIDEDKKCFRSKLSKHGTEIVSEFGRGTILDAVRDTKRFKCIRDVVHANGTEAAQLCELDYVKRMGEVVSTLAVPLLDSSGCVIGIVQVINRMASAEPFESQSIETLRKIAAYAAVALQNYRLLHDVMKQRGFALDHLEDLHTSSDVIETVVSTAKKSVYADYAVLFLVPTIEEDKGKYLLMYDGHEDDKSIQELVNEGVSSGEHDNWAMVGTNSLAGHCAATGEIINILDAQKDARRDKDMDRLLCSHRGAHFHRRAVLCVPIIDPRGNVTGVVQVMNKRARGGGTYRYFDPADETRLQGLLAAAAVSLKSAMLHDAADKSYWRLQRLLEVTKAVSREHDIHSLLKTVLDAAQAVVDASMGSIWTIDYDTDELCSSFIVPGAEIRIPLSAGIAGSVATSGKFEHVPDAYKDPRFNQDVDRRFGTVTRNILCAPLISSHGATLGVVQVLNKHGGRSFTAEDENLIQAFAAQAACSLENLQMFRHIHKLQQYANSVKPTADSICLQINKHGHATQSSINPLYVLGLNIEDMRRDPFPIWLGANLKLAASMAKILGFSVAVGAIHRTRSVALHNYSYINPAGETVLMNVTLAPTLTNAMSVRGLTVLMTNIKRHTVRKTVEARYNYGVSNMVRLPWFPLHDTAKFVELLPHRTISTDIEDAIEAASAAAAQSPQRGIMQSGSLATTEKRRLSMNMGSIAMVKSDNSPTSGRLTARRMMYKKSVTNPTHGEETEHDIYRNVEESSGAVLSLLMYLDPKHEKGFTSSKGGATSPTKNITDLMMEGADPDGIVDRISRSSLNRAFGRGVKMRLRPEDFKHHFRFEAMCLIIEFGGFVDRDYPHMLVATFGIRDADLSPSSNSGSVAASLTGSETMVSCSRCAMKLALLAQKYRQQMIRYEHNNKKDHQSSSLRLVTHVGIHSCAIPVSVNIPSDSKLRNIKTDDIYSNSDNSDTDTDRKPGTLNHSQQDSEETTESKETTEILSTFKKMDIDSDGIITASEFANGSSEMDALIGGKSTDQGLMMGVFSKIDKNNDGVIDEQEFINGYSEITALNNVDNNTTTTETIDTETMKGSESETMVEMNDEKIEKQIDEQIDSTSNIPLEDGFEKKKNLARRYSLTSIQIEKLDASVSVVSDVALHASNQQQEDETRTKPTSSSFETEDDSLIYKIDDTHVDFSVELSWFAKLFHLEVVISPQAMIQLDRSETVQMKDIIVRDLDILRSNAYPSRPCLKVFELIAFEHVGSHDPGLLKTIRHYETGLKRYRKRLFKEAAINFHAAIAISDDAPSSVMHARSKEYTRSEPPATWKGEWELSRAQYDLSELDR